MSSKAGEGAPRELNGIEIKDQTPSRSARFNIPHRSKPPLMPMMMTKMDSRSTQMTAEAGKSLMPTKPVLRLLDLPAEIRPSIYQGLLVNNFNGNEGRLWFSRWPVTYSYGTCWQLLRVCRPIHKEAAPMLYDENEFCTHVEPYRFGKDVVAHVQRCLCSPDSEAAFCFFGFLVP
jgi:hypothetical protein